MILKAVETKVPVPGNEFLAVWPRAAVEILKAFASPYIKWE